MGGSHSSRQSLRSAGELAANNKSKAKRGYVEYFSVRPFCTVFGVWSALLFALGLTCFPFGTGLGTGALARILDSRAFPTTHSFLRPPCHLLAQSHPRSQSGDGSSPRAEALALRGNAENQRGRFRAAASDFYRALREWPHHAEAWASLTQVDQIGLITSSGSLIFTAGLPFHSFIRFPNAFVSLAEFGVGLILTTRFERAWRPPWPSATGCTRAKMQKTNSCSRIILSS